jgi:T4 bacteriophage base plate protein.
MFDLEYILLILRARSVNNLIEFKIKDNETEEDVEVNLDIDNVSLTRYDDHTNEIAINDTYRLFLKYPTIEQFLKLTQLDENDPLADYLMLCTCIDYVASEDEVYYFKDYTQEEIDTFMDDLSGQAIKGIQKFFETMPRLRHEIKYTNKEGNEKHL